MPKAKKAIKKIVKKATARPKMQSYGKCFVISPFGGWFDSYYDSIFEPAIEGAGLTACRADDLYRPSSIIHDIWQYVANAKVLLADLTGKNPNVLYELGLAHAIGKPVVMVTQSLDDVPFDLRNLRVITYDLNDPGWASVLAESITHSLKEVLAQPESAVPPAFLKERAGTATPKVSPLEKKILELTQQVDSLRRSQRRISMADPVVGPGGARVEIERLIARGAPRGEIVERLARQGVPPSFVRREYEKARSELLRADQPTLLTDIDRD